MVKIVNFDYFDLVIYYSSTFFLIDIPSCTSHSTQNLFKRRRNDTTKVLVCRSQIPSCYVEFEYKYWIWIWKKIKINVNDMKLWMHVKMKASKYYPNNITTACILYNFCIWYMRRFRKLSWGGGFRGILVQYLIFVGKGLR